MSIGKITEQEKFCLCRDLLLLFPAEILPHRRTCQANKDFPPDEVCQERVSRTDNLPSRPLLARPVEEARLQSPSAAVSPLAEQVHWD